MNDGNDSDNKNDRPGAATTTGVTGGSPPFSPAPAGRLDRLLATPPRWWFHGVLAVVSGFLLWASTQGFGGFLLLAAVVLPVLAVAAVLWAARLVLFVRRRRAWSWWFAVAPAGALLVLGLFVADVPQRARWDASRPAFERVVAGLPPAPAAGDDWQPVDVPARIGAYGVQAAYRVHDGGLVFYDDTGSGLADDAGIAYLPAGPDPSLENGSFEAPSFEHLGGPWYAWTASW